ncbi:MAG TPA: hypothetical protein VM261_18355 [Kofleriaceae bacterium]|nr:hypothetical protein [Kofleriaceae bacterium]
MLLGACTIEKDPFEPTVDAGPGRVVLSPLSVNVNEGGNVGLFVHLESPPTSRTDVACTTADPRLEVHPTALTFLEDRPAQMALLLDAFQDADAINETVMVICTSPDFEDGIANADIFDDDVLAIVPTPNGSPPVTVAEAQTTVVTVRLAARPAYNLVVNVGRAGAKISPTPLQLVFTPENYNSPRNVTVTGVHDADDITDADTLVLSSTILNTVSVPFSVTDID